MNIVFIILAGIAGFFIGKHTASRTSLASPEHKQEARVASREALSERTEERKEKILDMMRNAREHYEDLKKCDLVEERKGIKREEVQELLDVSRKTALSYLNELEKDGKIIQINTGRNTYYRLDS